MQQEIDGCAEVESQMYEMRKNMPTYISSKKQILDDYESEKVCNATFSDHNTYKR